MKAFVFTAGMGRRLRPITEHIPKPALPVLNIPLVNYALAPLLHIGIQDLICNLHHLSSIMSQTLYKIKGIASLQLLQEGPHLLGSAGGLANAKSMLQDEEDFFVVNGDTLFLPNNPAFLKQVYEQHKKHKALATLVLTPDVVSDSSVWFHKETHKVFEFGDQKKEEIPYVIGGHFTGYYVLSRRIFKYCPYGHHIFKDVLSKAIQESQTVLCFHEKGHWFEVGNLVDFLKTTQALLDLQMTNSYLAEILSKHLTISNTHYKNVEISKTALIGNHVKIEEGCHVGEYSVLGDHVHLESGVHLHNTVVLPHCRVLKGLSYHQKVVYQ